VVCATARGAAASRCSNLAAPYLPRKGALLKAAKDAPLYHGVASVPRSGRNSSTAAVSIDRGRPGGAQRSSAKASDFRARGVALKARGGSTEPSLPEGDPSDHALGALTLVKTFVPGALWLRPRAPAPQSERKRAAVLIARWPG
jgi:hypothetical protein